MKILHIAPVQSSGNLPPFLLHQLESLDNGISQEIIFFRASNLSLRNPIQLISEIRSLRLRLKFSDSEIIHAHWGSVLGAVVAISRRRTSRMVLTLRGSDVNRALSENFIIHITRNLMTKLAIFLSDYIVYVSPQLKVVCPPGNKGSMIIPDGTPLDIFYPRPKNLAREKLNWDLDTKYIIFYCANRPVDKNLNLATQAISIVKEAYPDLSFLVIHNDLTQEDLAYVYSAADALLFTSLAEGSPNVVREAIACGCPVVSVNVGDVAHWIELSAAGNLCAYSAEELSLALIEVLKSNIRSNHHISHLFSTVSSRDKINEIYSELGGKVE